MSRQALEHGLRWCAWFWLAAGLAVIEWPHLHGHSPWWIWCMAPWAACETLLAVLRRRR